MEFYYGKRRGVAPSVVNGVIYVGSDDNNVYAFGSITVSQPSSTLPSPSPSLSPSASSKDSTSIISNGSLLIIIGIIIVIAAVITGLAVGLSMKKNQKPIIQQYALLCPILIIQNSLRV